MGQRPENIEAKKVLSEHSVVFVVVNHFSPTWRQMIVSGGSGEEGLL
jgi:hypothetical protein